MAKSRSIAENALSSPPGAVPASLGAKVMSSNAAARSTEESNEKYTGSASRQEKPGHQPHHHRLLAVGIYGDHLGVQVLVCFRRHPRRDGVHVAELVEVLRHRGRMMMMMIMMMIIIISSSSSIARHDGCVPHGTVSDVVPDHEGAVVHVSHGTVSEIPGRGEMERARPRRSRNSPERSLPSQWGRPERPSRNRG